MQKAKGSAHRAGRADRKSAQDLYVEQDSATFKTFCIKLLDHQAMTTLLFNKPCGVICQFSGNGSRATLADFIPVKDVYPTGRLDMVSEGLVILADDSRLQNRLSHPRHLCPRPIGHK